MAAGSGGCGNGSSSLGSSSPAPLRSPSQVMGVAAAGATEFGARRPVGKQWREPWEGKLGGGRGW